MLRWSRATRTKGKALGTRLLDTPYMYVIKFQRAMLPYIHIPAEQAMQASILDPNKLNQNRKRGKNTISKSDKWSSQWISNLSNWNKEAWKKNQGFNGIRTGDLCDCTSIAEVMGLNFFQASLFSLLKLEIHCDDHYHFHIIRSSYMNHFICITSV